MILSSPTGTGSLEITRISIEADSTSIDFEGQVEGYGTVFASHVLNSVNGDSHRGTTTGEARTFLLDGSVLETPHRGTFTRQGSSLQIYFTDAVNNGAVNCVIWDADILSKKAEVRYWEIKPGSQQAIHYFHPLELNLVSENTSKNFLQPILK